METLVLILALLILVCIHAGILSLLTGVVYALENYPSVFNYFMAGITTVCVVILTWVIGKEATWPLFRDIAQSFCTCGVR